MDPELPHLISDHFWFWGYGGASSPTIFHPARDAPRCLPCAFNRSRLDPAALPPGFEPPSGCPYCSWELLRKADARSELYTQGGGRAPRLVYPPVSARRLPAGPVAAQQGCSVAGA